MIFEYIWVMTHRGAVRIFAIIEDGTICKNIEWRKTVNYF